MKINKAVLAYTILSLAWGTTYLAIRVAVSVFPPGLFAGIRFVIAGGMILAFAKWRGLPFPKTSKGILLNALPGILIICGGNGTVMYASKWVHSGIISVIIATVPIFIALFETIERRKNILPATGWFGLFISFIGITLLASSGNKLGSINALGFVFVGSAALFSAAGSWISHKVTSGSVVVTAGLQMFFGGALMGLFGIARGEIADMAITSTGLWMMGYLIIVGSLMGYGAFVYLLSVWPPTIVATVSYINTVIAVLLGFVILSEPLSAMTIMASVIILGGVFLVQWGKER